MPKDPPAPLLLTDGGTVAAPPALIRAGLETLPAAIATADARTSERFICRTRPAPCAVLSM